ncbi:hypothetical protein C8R47DRAFT_243053 [Mycena vitilis]|nr:hypothetical protein C8R47DRAFT_243053 [Mycena vitilis]
MDAPTTFLPLSPSPSPPSAAHHLFATEQDAAAGMHHGQPYPAHPHGQHPSLLYASSPASSSSMDYGSYSNPLTLLPCDGADGMGVGQGVGQVGVSGKRYRSAPPKTFQCAGYGECRMVFSRSEHLARHIRKHTGERPFACHCTKQFSRLDNLRQHAQTVHSAPEDKPLNERMMRALAGVNASMMAGVRGRRRFGDASPHSPHSPQLSHLPHLAAAFSRDGEVYAQQEQPLPSPPYSASGFAWNAPPPPSSHPPSHAGQQAQGQGHPSFPPGAFSPFSPSTSSPSSSSARGSGSGSASPPFAYDATGAGGSPMPSPSLFGSFADVSGGNGNGTSPYPSPGAFYAQQQSPYEAGAQDYMSARVRVKQEDVGLDLDLDGFYAALEGPARGHGQGLSSYASSGSLSSLSSRSSASSLSSASEGEEEEEEERPETAHPPERASWQQQQGRPAPQQQQQQQRRLQLQQRVGGRGARGEYLPSPPQSPSFYGAGATSTYASASQHPGHASHSHPHPSHQHPGHPSQHPSQHAHHPQRQQQQAQQAQDNGGPFGWTLDDATPQGAGGAGEMSNAQYYAALQAQSQSQSSSAAHAQAQYMSSPYPSPHAHPMHQQQGGQGQGQEGYFYGAGGMSAGGGMGGQGGYAVFA